MLSWFLVFYWNQRKPNSELLELSADEGSLPAPPEGFFSCDCLTVGFKLTDAGAGADVGCGSGSVWFDEMGRSSKRCRLALSTTRLCLSLEVEVALKVKAVDGFVRRSAGLSTP